MALKAQIYAADPSSRYGSEVPGSVLRENAYARPRFNLLLFTVFAVLGLVLALFGIYGVISNAWPSRRAKSGFGSLWAPVSGQVLAMVLGMGARLLAVGVAVGLGVSLASVKLLKGLVQNVSTSTRTHLSR